MATDFQIGSTLGGILNLSALTTPVTNPKGEFTEFSETVKLGNGELFGVGFPQATWYYGFLPEDEYDQLRTFCAGASASVFIATLTNSNSFTVYSAVMSMPLTYQIRAGRYVDVEIKFTHLVDQTT